MRRILLAGAVVAAAMFVVPLDAATTYTYDTLGRLWVVTYDNGYQITYNYDSAGNRTSVVTQSGTSRPAQANNEYITVFENQTDQINPSSIATNPDGGTLSYVSVGAASHGTASLISGPNPVQYKPNTGYTGNDSFVYTISDASGHISSATVYVTVTNVGPVANSDNVSMPMNSVPVQYYPLANDVEPVPANSIWIYSVGSPSHGTVGINGGAHGTSLTYTPNANYMGTDIFPYTITDQTGLQSIANETITIGNPPVAVDDYILTAMNTPITYDPLSNDTDPNGFPISIALIGSSGNSSNSNVGGAAILYTPNRGFQGPDTFTYQITDGYLQSSAHEYVCVGSPLTAIDHTYSIDWNPTSPWIPILPPTGPPPDPRVGAVDACGAPFTVTGVGPASPQGTAIVDPGGTSISYSWGSYVNDDQHLVQTVTFKYTITDSYGATATATISVDINVRCCGG